MPSIPKAPATKHRWPHHSWHPSVPKKKSLSRVYPYFISRALHQSPPSSHRDLSHTPQVHFVFDALQRPSNDPYETFTSANLYNRNCKEILIMIPWKSNAQQPPYIGTRKLLRSLLTCHDNFHSALYQTYACKHLCHSADLMTAQIFTAFETYLRRLSAFFQSASLLFVERCAFCTSSFESYEAWVCGG